MRGAIVSQQAGRNEIKPHTKNNKNVNDLFLMEILSYPQNNTAPLAQQLVAILVANPPRSAKFHPALPVTAEQGKGQN